MKRTALATTTLVVGAVLMTSACAQGSTPEGGDAAAGIVVGTTDKVVSLDPAVAYDGGSNVIITNVYERLLEYPEGETTPQPSLATACDYTGETAYECTIPEGRTFSNGDALTASDVAFSFNRILTINEPTGPISLFANLEKAEAVNDTTVRFTLKNPDQTWSHVLAAPSSAIVDEEVFAADAGLDSEKVVGSGPYQLTTYTPDQQVVLSENQKYGGEHRPKSATAIMQYFQSSSALKLALEQGTVQVAYRALDPADLEALRAEPEKATVLEGAGTNLNFIGFNLDLEPGKQESVRRAVAYSIDRQAIIDNVYDGVGTPLYSMVNEGVEGYTEAYKDVYGANPDVDAAKAELEKAGITEPVAFDLWWTPSHYGTLAGDEYTEISRQLNETGLFKVTLKSSEWQQYVGAALGDQYGVYQLGGAPDYPSALNALGGFYIDGGFLNNHYSDARINKLAAQAIVEPEAAKRNELLAEIQSRFAEAAPTVPLWQGKRVAATSPEVTGVEETLDMSGLLRLWNIAA